MSGDAGPEAEAGVKLEDGGDCWLVSGLAGPSGDMGVSAMLSEGGESGPEGDIQDGRDNDDGLGSDD